MFEIVLIALLAVLMAHRRRGGKRRYNLRKVRINSAPAIGALDVGDVVSVSIINVAADTYRLISFKAAFTWANKATQDDSLTFGLAHSDYSAAEVEEALEAVTSIDLGDKVAQERANRLVREIGVIGGKSDTSAGGADFNDGRQVKVRLNWLMSIGDQLNLWMRNASGVIYTTGGTVTVSGAIWLKDGG